MFPLIFIYIFSLFIILSPGFLFKKNTNVLNSIIFICIFALTFPVVYNSSEGYTTSTKIEFENIPSLIKIIKNFNQQFDKSLIINNDFSNVNCIKNNNETSGGTSDFGDNE